MPRNSALGFVIAFFAVVLGFAMIWHIWWMAVAGLLGAFVTMVVFAFRDDGRSRDLGRADGAVRRGAQTEIAT